MVDNSWIHEKSSGSSGWHSKMMRTKVIITVAAILAGAVLSAALNGLGSNATMYQSEGIVMDFGEYNTVWTDADYNETEDPLELLDLACVSNGYTYSLNGGILASVNDGTQDYTNGADGNWGLWYVERESTEYSRAENYNIDASDYTVVVWAYTSGDVEPAVAVDATGTSVYGYAQPASMVTLSPVCTEIAASLNAVSLLVGTDKYSNYPSSVVVGRNNGTIAVVGTYTDPSYESIMNTSPDMVICDGSQYNHVQTAKTLRNSEIASVVIYDADDMQSIIDNVFLVATAMNYALRAQEVIKDIETAMSEIEAAVAGGEKTAVLMPLSTDHSPTVAGSGTYAGDMMVLLNGNNVASEMTGWVHLNVEYVSKYNPSCIIILDSDTYSADEYDWVMSGLAKEWKDTDAYKNGKIYLLCEDMGEMSQRASPRSVQFFEILARILNPDAFPGEEVLPKAIGSDYEKYLTYTKDMGFGD